MVEAGYAITSHQNATKSAISANPGVDQASLAALIAYDRVAIGKVVYRLVDKGLVEGVLSPRHRHAREFELSARGSAFLKKPGPIVRDLQSDIITGLPGNKASQFLTLLKKTRGAGNEVSRSPLRSAS